MRRKLAIATVAGALASLALLGGAQAAEVGFSPANLDFGIQTVGTTSAPITYTVQVTFTPAATGPRSGARRAQAKKCKRKRVVR